MAQSHAVTMLGTGLIGGFYTAALHDRRNPDRVGVVYSRSEQRARAFADEWRIPVWTTDLREAIEHPETDTVVVGLPNDVSAAEQSACRTKLILKDPQTGAFEDRVVGAT